MSASSIVRLNDPALAAAWCEEARVGGGALGFVATMGALHAGHVALVRRAVAENERTCVSVFVNPLQFEEAHDLERYPRDFEGDVALLAEAGCDMVFTGTLWQFFPGHEPGAIPRRDPGDGATGLEGTHRAGHFEGVATIVTRLFELVRPTRAYFGQKDFQQTLVVRHVARNFAQLEIVVGATVRAPSGLALSSRNARLDAAGRRRAEGLSAVLLAARGAWRGGVRDARALEALMRAELVARGIDVEYAAVRDPNAWSATRPDGDLRCAQALIAARVGAVRLIDNIALHEEEPEPAHGAP